MTRRSSPLRPSMSFLSCASLGGDKSNCSVAEEFVIREPVSASEFIASSPTCRAPVQLSQAEEGARVLRAPHHASSHLRNVLNEARTSSVKIFGCSHAAKWQPL